MKAVAKLGAGLCLVLASMVSSIGFASPEMDAADALFARRGEGLAVIGQARDAYKDLLGSLSGDELVHAVEQLARLAYYEGEDLTPRSNRSHRVDIFQDCRDFIERIANIPAAASKFHYWKTACTAFWVQSAPQFTVLTQIGGIKRYFDSVVGEDLEIKSELGIDTRYIGGGLYRALGATYSDPLSRPLNISALPNREKAVEFLDRALAEGVFPGDANAADSYYMNQRSRAEVLIAAGRSSEAQQYLRDTIAEVEGRIAAGDLPVGLEPETTEELRIMREILAGHRN